MTDDYILTRWTADDWQDFRALRLKAIQNMPSVFLRSYAEEAEKPAAYWQDPLQRPDEAAIFGLYYNGSGIGLTGAFRDRDPPYDSVSLGMSYIDDTHRRRGLSALFYTARLDWARSLTGVTQLCVSHRDGNAASQAAIEKNGFVKTGTTLIQYADGSNGLSHSYALKLGNQ